MTRYLVGWTWETWYGFKKILHGFLEDVQWRDFFQMVNTSTLRREFPEAKEEGKFTFSQRIVNMWNDLPADIGPAPTTNELLNPPPLLLP